MDPHTHSDEAQQVPAVQWRLRSTFLEFYSTEDEHARLYGGCASRRAVSVDAAYSHMNQQQGSPFSNSTSPLFRRTWPFPSSDEQQSNECTNTSGQCVGEVPPSSSTDHGMKTTQESIAGDALPFAMASDTKSNWADMESQNVSKSRHSKRRKAKGNDNTDGSSGILEKTATTVMVRHIACRYTQEEAAIFLDEIGLKEKYDFIYLPLNPTKRANLGYMFINFLKPEYVTECKQLLTGQPFGATNTTKRCEVTLAHVQGYANISRHFQKKAVMKGRHAPLFIQGGDEPTTQAGKDQHLHKFCGSASGSNEAGA